MNYTDVIGASKAYRLSDHENLRPVQLQVIENIELRILHAGICGIDSVDDIGIYTIDLSTGVPVEIVYSYADFIALEDSDFAPFLWKGIAYFRCEDIIP